MIADPAFMVRLLLEQATTIGTSVLWEVQNRKERYIHSSNSKNGNSLYYVTVDSMNICYFHVRIKQEWDLALINVLTVTACNAIVVWSLAPCRSYGSTFQTDLQNTLQKLPNNIFESSYKYRDFDIQKRLLSFLYRAAELSMVGFTAGAAQGALSNFTANKKDGRYKYANNDNMPMLLCLF